MTSYISIVGFTSFPSRGHKSCLKRYINEEIQFSIDVFIENGYGKKTLDTISNMYLNKMQNLPANNKEIKILIK